MESSMEYDSFNDTLRGISNNVFVEKMIHGNDAEPSEEKNMFEEIDEILDSCLAIKDAFETTEEEENAPASVEIEEDFAILRQADMEEALQSTFDKIDQGIIETLERNFLPDDIAFRRKFKFPASLADENNAASTFDSHFIQEKSVNDGHLDIRKWTEGSIRPITKCFAPLDQSLIRNSFYDHSAGFKDYDKIAMDRILNKFHMDSVLPNDLFRCYNATFEPSRKSQVDIRKLIEEFQEFLRIPENAPRWLKCYFESNYGAENDHWDVKKLKEVNDLRNRIRGEALEDDGLKFLFANLTAVIKFADREGKYSQVIDNFGDAYVLDGLPQIDLNNQNPYVKEESVAHYKSELSNDREACTGTFPLYPGRRQLPSKMMTAPEIKEVKTGLPFELKGERTPYECPRVVQEYANHLIVRVALNRYLVNDDDSLAHLILYKLLDARPDAFYAQEAFRILIHPSRSMSHKEIYTLVRIANEYQCFDSSLHYLLAMNHFRGKNFVGMDEEISNWCFSMRYSGQNKFYHPFPETAEAEKSTFKENNEMVFTGERKAMILSSCLYILNLNYGKARSMLRRLRSLDYEALEDEEILHWTYTMDAQAQIGMVNPYAQNPKTFFTKTSDFFCLSAFETMHEMERLVEYFTIRRDTAKVEEAIIPEAVKELNYRLLLMQYIYLEHHSLSAEDDYVEEIDELYKSFCSVPFYDGKTKKLERLAKTLYRSYNLSIGQKSAGAQLTCLPEPQLTRDDHDGYTVEGSIIDTILNAYEIAYTGKFVKALEYVDKLEIANNDGVIGCHHISIARACIEFDEAFFNGGRVAAEKKMSKLYDVCPLEALFRDVPLQIIYGELKPSMLKQLNQVLNHSSSIHVLPTVQIRCRISISQFYMECERYREAIEELNKALVLAWKLKLQLYETMINRRIAMVYTVMGKIYEAYKVIEKCKAVQSNIKIPSLEAGLIYFAKYIIHQKANKLEFVHNVKVLPNYALEEYIMKAQTILKPFSLIYKWVIAAEQESESHEVLPLLFAF